MVLFFSTNVNLKIASLNMYTQTKMKDIKTLRCLFISKLIDAFTIQEYSSFMFAIIFVIFIGIRLKPL